MIITANGRQIVFGMNWKARLSEGDLHGDARDVKARYFWHGSKAHSFGVLTEQDSKRKVKGPLYSGAIALLNRYPDVPNLVMVLAIPEAAGGGFIVCGIHQGRPRHGSDAVVKTEAEVSDLLTEFQAACNHQSFKLYGDVKIGGIEAAAMDDVLRGADQTAQLRKTRSAMANPIALLAAGTVILGAGAFALHSYTAYKKAEALRLLMAAQNNSQQLYTEELAARRQDATILVRDLQGALAPLRAMSYSLGGWGLSTATCTLPPEKQMVCTFEYVRRPESRGTYETFVAAAKQFDNLEFAGETIRATKIFKALPFVDQGRAIDAGKTQHEEIIEFGSSLQRIAHLGESKRDEYQAYALPPGASVGELTSPPITAAGWQFTGPFRDMKHLADFPAYATVSQLLVTYTDKPAYEAGRSMAMVTVAGKIFAKPN